MDPIALVLLVVASASAQGTVSDYFIDYGGECLIREVDSYGSDIAGGFFEGIPSVADCQELCKNNDGCKYFLYGETGIHSERCWLKNQTAESLTPLEGMIFGPKTCERTTVTLYEVVHDGHCASGWNGPNTIQESILGCRNECAGRPDVGFFAYNGDNCACYFLKDGCPDDDQHGDHDAYLIVDKDTCVNTRDNDPMANSCSSQLGGGSTCVNYLKWKDCDASCNLCACSTASGVNRQHCNGNGVCEAACTKDGCEDAKCRCYEGAEGEMCESNDFEWVADKTECGGSEKWGGNFGEEGVPADCANVCRHKDATMFAFGTNKWGTIRQGHCYCETAATAEGTCNKVGHNGYRLYRFTEPEPCGIGEIHISKTMGCTGYGYTCLLDKDGPQCCGGRYDKTPTCEKCDNTVSKKPDGGYFYTTPGACDYLPVEGYCTGVYFETGDEAGNGKDRPPPGTQCAGGCIEGAVGNTDRWGNTYCDTVDGNWGAECLECRTLEFCTGNFQEANATDAGNRRLRPDRGTECVGGCLIEEGRWGQSWCWTEPDTVDEATRQWGANCLPCPLTKNIKKAKRVMESINGLYTVLGPWCGNKTAAGQENEPLTQELCAENPFY